MSRVCDVDEVVGRARPLSFSGEIAVLWTRGHKCGTCFAEGSTCFIPGEAAAVVEHINPLNKRQIPSFLSLTYYCHQCAGASLDCALRAAALQDAQCSPQCNGQMKCTRPLWINRLLLPLFHLYVAENEGPCSQGWVHPLTPHKVPLMWTDDFMTEYVKPLKILQAAKTIEGPCSSISVWSLCTSLILGKAFSVSLVERSIPGAAGHQEVVKVEGKSAHPPGGKMEPKGA